jgi:hypothetical protein
MPSEPKPYYKSECRPTTELEALWKESGFKSTQTVPLEKFREWLDTRDRCRKDLYLLLTLSPLGAYPGGEIPQREMCDQFVKKNFDGFYHEGYTLDEVHQAVARQPREREMLLLAPRGSTKSYIDCADCVSWLLNGPDLRVLILTGEYKLASAFMSDVKRYFYLPEGAKPSVFQTLFPEYVIRGMNGYNDQPLECPARIHGQREASLWVNSITANLSGWHCDVKKGDDVVTDENSETEPARAKVNDKYDGTENLVDEWGFIDHLGTRYFLNDWYGKRLETVEEFPLKFFKRQCWTVRKPFLHVPLNEIKKEMVELWFPAKLTWASLRQKMRKERLFCCQQLNDPPPDPSTALVHFNEDELRAALEQHTAVPKTGEVVITCDWAPTSTAKADYSCIVAARIDKDLAEAHVLEVEYGRWRSSELAGNIVRFAKKFSPRCILIEKAPGTELLQNEIAREARRQQVATPIMWLTVDNKLNAKCNRIKGIEILLKEGRIHFVQGPWVDEMFAQFCRYTGLTKNKGRKDDIPDAVSMLQFFMPAEPTNPVDAAELVKLRKEEAEKAALDAHYRQVFNRNPVPLRQPVGPPRRNPYDLSHLGVSKDLIGKLA